MMENQVFLRHCVWVVLLIDRSTGSELNLSRFSHFRHLEKLQLRANNGLTLADGCTDLTNVGGLVHLKTLVSMICLTFFHIHITDVVVTIQPQFMLYLYTWIICGHHLYPATLYFLKFRHCTRLFVVWFHTRQVFSFAYFCVTFFNFFLLTALA